MNHNPSKSNSIGLKNSIRVGRNSDLTWRMDRRNQSELGDNQIRADPIYPGVYCTARVDKERGMRNNED